MDVILERLSNYMEKAMKLKARVKGAMTYPAAVLVISMCGRGFIAPQSYSCISSKCSKAWADNCLRLLKL